MSGVLPPHGPPQGAMPPPGHPMGGAPMGPVGVPPGAVPNPAFAQWMQASQAAQAVMQANAQKQAQFDAACELIRKDGVRGFKLDIEADSTIAPDENAEKIARVQFLQQIVPLIQQITPIAQGNPEMASLAGEIAMFAVRGFRVARTLEEAFEKAFKVLGTMPPQPPKGAAAQKAGPDPQLEQAKLIAQVHDTQTRAQSAQHVADAKAQTDQSVAAAKAQTDQLAIAQKEQAAAMQFQAARERADQEDQNNQARMMLEVEKMQMTERQHAAQLASRAAGKLE